MSAPRKRPRLPDTSRRARPGPLALAQPGLRAVPYGDVETHLANGWQALALYPDHALMAAPAPRERKSA